jgi:hypothetical protein
VKKAMVRTPAAVALILTLFASQTSAFACLADCEPVEHQSAAIESSCHRAGNHAQPAPATQLAAAPHDCSSHASETASLVAPKTAVSSQLRIAPAACLVPAGDAVTHSPRFSLSARSLHDLAPPGRSIALIAPLRI